MSQPRSSSHFPYLPIRIRIGKSPIIEQEIHLEPLVDTDFDGSVAVPQDSVDPSIRPDTHLVRNLADGTEILTPAYLGYVDIGDHDPVATVIIALAGEALLGREVTNHFTLIFDHGQRVIVEA